MAIAEFSQLSHTSQALLATLFTWGVTAVGAAAVLVFKQINQDVMDAMLGFSGGVMLAASYFSLLAPSIEMSEALGLRPWLTVCTGLGAGGLLLYAQEKLMDRLEKQGKMSPSAGKKRCITLVLSITLHNIPEGLAVGVAFGSLYYGIDGATLTTACMLALGIGLQNFPEGTAVSVPLRREGMSRGKAFFFGQLSAVVEPIAGVLGALLVMRARAMLPYMLSFAAGAMLYAVVGELIPESQKNRNKSRITAVTLGGFLIMTVLDLALG